MTSPFDQLAGFALRGAGAQRAVDDQGAGSVERAGWRVLRVSDARLELQLRDEVRARLSKRKGGAVEVVLVRGHGEDAVDEILAQVPGGCVEFALAWFNEDEHVIHAIGRSVTVERDGWRVAQRSRARVEVELAYHVRVRLWRRKDDSVELVTVYEGEEREEILADLPAAAATYAGSWLTKEAT